MMNDIDKKMEEVKKYFEDKEFEHEVVFMGYTVIEKQVYILMNFPYSEDEFEFDVDNTTNEIIRGLLKKINNRLESMKIDINSWIFSLSGRIKELKQ